MTQVGGAIVLLLVSVAFGAFGKTAEMGLSILAGALSLGFANLHRIKMFSGAGFKAETWELVAAQKESDVAPSKQNYTDLRAEGDNIADETPRGRHSRLRSERKEVYLVHEIRPSSHKRYPYDALIYVRGAAERGIEHVKSAEFFLGKGFDDQVFKGKPLSEKQLGISVAVRGEFFCTCLVSFDDGEEILLDRYIDFGTIRWMEGMERATA